MSLKPRWYLYDWTLRLSWRHGKRELRLNIPIKFWNRYLYWEEQPELGALKPHNAIPFGPIDFIKWYCWLAGGQS